MDKQLPFIDEQFLDQMATFIGKNESDNRYDLQPNVAGAMGRYQFTRGRMKDLGYGGVSNQEFINNPAMQDEAFKKHVEDHTRTFIKKGWITPESTPGEYVGLMMSAHLGGIGGAAKVMNGGGFRKEDSDAFGTSVGNYYQRGMKAFGGGSRPVATHPLGVTESSTSPKVIVPTTGINPKTQALIDRTQEQNDFDEGDVAYDGMVLKQQSKVKMPRDFKAAIQPAESVFNKFLPTAETMGDMAEGMDQGFDGTYYLHRPSGIRQVLEGSLGSFSEEFSKKNGIEADFTGGISSHVGRRLNPFDPGINNLEKNFNNEVARIRAENPNTDLSKANWETFLLQASEQAKKIEVNTSSRAEESWSKAIGRFIGSAGAYVADPAGLLEGVAMTFIPGMKAAQIAGRAAAGGAIEAVVQAPTQQARGALGLESGVGEALKEVATVAGGSVVGDIAFAGAKGLWRSVAKRFSADPTPVGQSLALEAEHIADTVAKNPLPSIDDLDGALIKTNAQVEAGQPVTITQEMIDNIKLDQVDPTPPAELTALMDTDLPNAQALAQQGADEWTAIKADVANNAPSLPQPHDVIDSNIQAVRSTIDTAAERELTPAAQQLNDTFEGVLNREATARGLPLDEVTRERLLDETMISIDTPEGTVVEQSLRQVKQDLDDAVKVNTEFTDCIGSQFNGQ